MSLNERETYFANLCHELAEKAFSLQEVPVGCVFVYGEEVIGRGHNDVNRTKNPTRHAEFVAIDEAHEWCAKNGRNFDEIMRQTVVYVNLEPCIMCASALYQIKIAKLVFGAKNPRFGGIESVASNQSYGHEHEIQIVSGIFEERSIAILRRFYNRENCYAPLDKRKTKNKQSADPDGE